MEVQIFVKNMICHNCAKVLRNALEHIPGINNIVIKKQHKIIYIYFDPNHITLNRIVEIIQEKGYAAEIQHARKGPELL